MMSRARDMHPLKVLATTVGVALLVWGLLFAYLSSPAWAAAITVNSLADDADGADGECTLREAITSANDNTASGTATGECAAGSSDTTDVINIGTSAVPLTGTVQLTSSLPDFSSNMEIRGPGADKFTVRRSDTAQNFRISFVASDSEVSISGITISGGKDPSPIGLGGGIRNRGILTISGSTISGNSVGDRGGGIHNSGTLTISGSTISGNSAGLGGGIDNSGTLTITSSTISGNSANGGGGIRNSGTLTISGSTISGNSADGGGGIANSTLLSGTQKTTITNSTISGNSADGGAGGVYNQQGLTEIEFSTITNNTVKDDAGTVQNGLGSGVFSSGNTFTRTEVASSIISANQGTDVDFTEAGTNSFVSGGFNLIGDGNATGAFSQTGLDTIDVADPGLDPLDSYGGPTQTHRLQSDSPALDAATRCPPGTTDQRGVIRPQGSACDIGAYELEVEVQDTTPPFVTLTSPLDQGGLKKTEDVTAEFSEKVKNVTPSTFILERRIAVKKSSPPKFERVLASVSPPSGEVGVGELATLNPAQDLPKGDYRATITTEVTDMAGNALDQKPDQAENQPKVWTFTVKK